MRWIATLTIFTNAVLLFSVQPIVAKIILPSFGGTAAVWTASMLFFQAVLLAGYGYSHWLTRSCSGAVQFILHATLLLIGFATLPFSLPGGYVPSSGGNVPLQVVVLLARMVGLPFFAISAGAPLIQRWFSQTSDPQAKDPYFLYAASNLGSLIALLAYPVLIEPRWRLGEQASIYKWSFLVLIGALVFYRLVAKPVTREPAADEDVSSAPTWTTRLRWIGLAAIPSSLMLGVTNYLTTNLAPIPLLWIVPLALYLITFILAFSERVKISAKSLAIVVPLIIAPLWVILIMEATTPIALLTAFHLFGFFFAAWMCHRLLAEERPSADHLTEFYFCLSIGGVIGGFFNAIFAPLAFKTLLEYPLAILAACIVRPSRNQSTKMTWLNWAAPVGLFLIVIVNITVLRRMGMTPSAERTALVLGLPVILAFLAVDRPLRFAACLGAVYLAVSLTGATAEGQIIASHRSFYGVHRVVEVPLNKLRVLIHGNTIHGEQSTDPSKRRNALTYYHRTGPIGSMMLRYQPEHRFHRVALVGLGVGSLATYALPGDDFVFFEIDPTVIEIAKDPRYFSFLSDSPGRVSTLLGDARITMATQPDGLYDLIVLDAFSSDSIPIHLLTKEAVELYLRKLRPGGILAFHISNRYLDLEPWVFATVKSIGLTAKFQEDGPTPDEVQEGKTPSRWLLAARNKTDYGVLDKDYNWDTPYDDARAQPWTDDYSNLLSAFKRDDD